MLEVRLTDVSGKMDTITKTEKTKYAIVSKKPRCVDQNRFFVSIQCDHEHHTVENFVDNF